MRVAGLDIGGTKTAIGVFDDGHLLEKYEVPSTGFEETMDAIIDWLAPHKIESLGIGCAGPLDDKKGTMRNVTSLPTWFDKPIIGALEGALKVPTSMVNDADAALLGELWQGALKDFQNESALLLTLGTGVGGAYWTGSQRLIGANGEHPEIGHIFVKENGWPCACGLHGCLEAEVAGSSLDKKAVKLGWKNFPDLVANGDPSELLAEVRQCMDIALRTYAAAFRPWRVVIGGGLMDRLGSDLLPYMHLTSREAPMLEAPMAILKAKLGNEAGIYGGAAMALGILR